MRRSALGYVFIALAVFGLTSEGIDAQRTGKVRGRQVSRQKSGLVTLPSISIHVPTALETFQTNATDLALAGSAFAEAGLKSVTWTCSPSCGVASGSALAPFDAWTIPIGAAGSLTSFQDTFEPAGGNVSITARNPNIGTGWTEDIDTLGSLQINASNGFSDAVPSGSDGTGNLLGAKAGLVSALSGSDAASRDYLVSLKVSRQASSADDAMGIRFGGTDASNFCVLWWYPAGAAGNDLFITRYVGDVGTQIASAAGVANVGVGSIPSIDVDGTTLTAKVGSATVFQVTSSNCGGTEIGVLYGDIIDDGTDDISSGNAFDDFTVTDRGTASDGINHSSNGTYTVTVTATDNNDVTASDVLTVTKGATDSVAPVTQITLPSPLSSYQTATPSFSPSGTATDNVGVVSGTCTCSGSCSPGSRSMVIANNPDATAVTWTLTAAFTLALGAPQTLSCTTQDTQGNTSQAKTQSVTLVDTSDTSDPVISFTSPTTGTTYTATTTPLLLIGTCVDNVGCTNVAWTNSAGGSGAASGTSTFNASINLTPGVSNVVTVTGLDLAGRIGTKTLTVTYNGAAALQISSATALPPHTTGVAYSYQESATGGQQPYTFVDHNSGTTTITGSNCPNLAISSAGAYSGQSVTSPPVTCTFTVRVTDNLGATAVKQHTIAVIAVGDGPNDWFDSLSSHPNYWKSNALQPAAGHPCTGVYVAKSGANANYAVSSTPSIALARTDDWCGDPYYTYTLNSDDVANKGYQNKRDSAWPKDWTYSPATDTHPNAQYASKAVITAFAPWPVAGPATLPKIEGSIASGAENDLIVLTVVRPDGTHYSSGAQGPSELNAPGRMIYIDGEFFNVVSPVCSPSATPPVTTNCAFNRWTGEWTLRRGQLGTAAAHTAGQHYKLNQNTIWNSVKFPLVYEEGNTYATIVDYFVTDSLMVSGLTNHKQMNFLSRGIWNEPNVAWSPVGCPAAVPPGFVAFGGTAHFKMRGYNVMTGSAGNTNPPPEPIWSLTDGDHLGPNATSDEPLCPATPFEIFPNRWIRLITRHQLIANDWDLVDVWIGDEQRAPADNHVITALQVSLTPVDPARDTPGPQIESFAFEMNTSTDLWKRGPLCQPVSDLTTCDLVYYYRNLAVLRQSGTAATGNLSNTGLATLLADKPKPAPVH